jgi:hypothetical protein
VVEVLTKTSLSAAAGRLTAVTQWKIGEADVEQLLAARERQVAKAP